MLIKIIALSAALLVGTASVALAGSGKRTTHVAQARSKPPVYLSAPRTISVRQQQLWFDRANKPENFH